MPGNRTRVLAQSAMAAFAALCLGAVQAFAQTVQVRGVVTDSATGKPLSSAVVMPSQSR